jgi:hypothetical protein
MYTQQLLLTPGFVAGQYPSSTDCYWRIRATNNTTRPMRVQLSIADSHMEDRLFTNCDDYVRALDSGGSH